MCAVDYQGRRSIVCTNRSGCLEATGVSKVLQKGVMEPCLQNFDQIGHSWNSIAESVDLGVHRR